MRERNHIASGSGRLLWREVHEIVADRLQEHRCGCHCDEGTRHQAPVDPGDRLFVAVGKIGVERNGSAMA